MIRIEKQRPNDFDIFPLEDGNKIRIDYDKVWIYKSFGKQTKVDLGFSNETETYILDVSFDSFNEKYTNFRNDMREYWNSLES